MSGQVQVKSVKGDTWFYMNYYMCLLYIWETAHWFRKLTNPQGNSHLHYTLVLSHIQGKISICHKTIHTQAILYSKLVSWFSLYKLKITNPVHVHLAHSLYSNPQVYISWHFACYIGIIYCIRDMSLVYVLWYTFGAKK